MKKRTEDREVERNVKARARVKSSGNGREYEYILMFYSVGHSPFYWGFK